MTDTLLFNKDQSHLKILLIIQRARTDMTTINPNSVHGNGGLFKTAGVCKAASLLVTITHKRLLAACLSGCPTPSPNKVIIRYQAEQQILWHGGKKTISLHLGIESVHQSENYGGNYERSPPVAGKDTETLHKITPDKHLLKCGLKWNDQKRDNYQPHQGYREVVDPEIIGIQFQRDKRYKAEMTSQIRYDLRKCPHLNFLPPLITVLYDR